MGIHVYLFPLSIYLSIYLFSPSRQNGRESQWSPLRVQTQAGGGAGGNVSGKKIHRERGGW